MPIDYPWLYDTVAPRFANAAALEAALPQPLSPQALRAQGDDRYLSAMTQRVFQAGMQHSVVDGKWPAFEAAFAGFDPQTLARHSAQDMAAYLDNPAIIRDRTKLLTIPKNAQFILEVAQENGQGFGAFLADWPDTDTIGLWQVLARRGARLGGRSAAGFLRLAGKDSFLLTSHVVERLVLAGVVERTPTSQRDLQRVQAAFNALQERSGRPLCQLSALLALSISPQGQAL
ncbi:MAG: DNA-3-methyladenine glycosylase I [Comamonas sp.]|nr:DNA-3-methyladenine glycosylase I [Comamonas sp.]